MLQQMLARSRALFIREYNNKLFNWLVIFSLTMVVIGRFVVKLLLLEAAAWVMFIFLETYTRLFWSSESLYYNPVWHAIVSSWEAIVYSPVLDLDRLASFLPWWQSPQHIHRSLTDWLTASISLLQHCFLFEQMGNPNCCHDVFLSCLLALHRRKGKDRSVGVTPVQWVFQKQLRSAEDRLTPSTFERYGYGYGLIDGCDFRQSVWHYSFHDKIGRRRSRILSTGVDEGAKRVMLLTLWIPWHHQGVLISDYKEDPPSLLMSSWAGSFKTDIWERKTGSHCQCIYITALYVYVSGTHHHLYIYIYIGDEMWHAYVLESRNAVPDLNWNACLHMCKF